MLNWLVYICFGVGLFFVASSVMGYIKEEKEHSGDNFDMEGMIEAMDRSINNADDTAEELTKISQDVVSEIDDKYQQLLFLYGLIDEKTELLKNGMINISVGDRLDAKTDIKDHKKQAEKNGFDINLINNKYKTIFELYNNGEKIADIAKRLGIGQGEVKLVLELGKGR